MSRRYLKERQSRRLNWMIQQELADQSMRDEQEQDEAALPNTMESLDCGTPHAIRKAFATIEQKGVNK